jgi:hypothetical protein
VTAEPVPAPSDPESKPQPQPKPAKRAGKKLAAKKPSKKPAAKDLNKSEEIRKVAAKMKAGGQKVRPSLIVQELAKQTVVVAPAQVILWIIRRVQNHPSTFSSFW